MSQSNLSQQIELLEKRSNSIRKRILKNPSAKSFFNKSTLIAHDLRRQSSRLLAGAGLVGALLTSPIQTVTPLHSLETVAANTVSAKQKLLGNLQEILPHRPTKLGPEASGQIEKIVFENIGIVAKTVLEDQSLNHTLGYIGFEQHLKRYPGDVLSLHDEIQEAGMAPGIGAFGYFTNDSQSFTTKEYQREKYYCVVQTLYLENWNRDYRQLKDWYKFRKMLVINPVNGEAVVCAIGDAGPAEWTGKQFGGSPETMESLGLNKGPRKGLILMMFVDDPDNKVPLGPVNY